LDDHWLTQIGIWAKTLEEKGWMLNRRSLLAAAMLLPTRQALANTTHRNARPWPTALLMGTGRPGGAYAVYGPAWGALAQKASGVSIAFVASGGAATDILLIEQGAAQLGMTTVTVANQARSGTGAWTAGARFESFRALFPIFPSVLQIVSAAGRGIARLQDLSDRSIGIGPDGGSGSAAVPAMLASLGIMPSNCLTGDYAPQLGAMLAGELAACAFIGAPPLPAIQRAAQANRLAMIGFTTDEARHVVRATPGMTAMTLPAGMFRNQTMPIASVGTANFAIGAAALPDGLVSELTLIAMRDRPQLAALVPAVADALDPMLGGQNEMPFHPGAASALRRLGMNVPARFVES
jgi:TRAP transporter TAXI family solute receptor